ncbi:hypothetical protein FALCPG4_012901 [Fusarium falciforme]
MVLKLDNIRPRREARQKHLSGRPHSLYSHFTNKDNQSQPYQSFPPSPLDRGLLPGCNAGSGSTEGMKCTPITRKSSCGRFWVRLYKQEWCWGGVLQGEEDIRVSIKVRACPSGFSLERNGSTHGS